MVLLFYSIAVIFLHSCILILLEPVYVGVPQLTKIGGLGEDIGEVLVYVVYHGREATKKLLDQLQSGLVHR